MANEAGIQQIIHKLEEGGWARWVWVAVLSGAVIYVSYAWIFKDSGFKGLSHPRAFEQAVEAREIARGHGFTTRIIRPAELWLFREHNRTYPVNQIPETYQAPLWPAVLAPFLLTVKNTWPMNERTILYTSDQVIAGVGLGLFILSVVVNFFIAQRIFDQRMAFFGIGLMLLCDEFWRFSMSGLPQMLMLFLFSLAVYALVRLVQTYHLEREYAAEDARLAMQELAREGPTPPPLPPGIEPQPESEPEVFAPEDDRPAGWVLPAWSAAAGLGFGLLALAHGLTLWIFAGAVLFAALSFTGARLRGMLPLLLVGVLCYLPWLVRNYQVCGSIGGVAWYSILYQVRGGEDFILRSKDSPVAGATPIMFYNKVQTQLLWQLGSLPKLLGYVMVAPVFFMSLLHGFKRRSTASFRWCVLLMWLAAFLGMGVFGLDGRPFQSNDLHVLFIPLFAIYGMAYTLVLWSRLEVNVRLIRLAFITLIYVVSSGPFIVTFIALHMPSRRGVEWPPYLPPYIAILGNWTNEREIIMSDMPWAVAWYADRRSLWLPMTVKEFNELNDYKLLEYPIVGMYLTPVSGDLPFQTGIVTGEFQAWAPFILRTNVPRNFALRAVTVLPYENKCIFYADRDRWTMHED